MPQDKTLLEVHTQTGLFGLLSVRLGLDGRRPPDPILLSRTFNPDERALLVRVPRHRVVPPRGERALLGACLTNAARSRPRGSKVVRLCQIRS